MIQNDPLGGLRQGTAAVGALAKPLDAVLPGAGSTLQTMLQLSAMSLPSLINHTPINPYNTNPMGVVGFRNLGGTLNGVPGYLYGGNQDQQITKDAFKVQGNSGIDTNFRRVEGQNALLTQNEIVSKLKDGSNYVFSDHIKNPLTGNSIAKDAEKLKKKQKQAEERAATGDVTSKRTVDKIKSEVDNLSKINDMALQAVQEVLGEQTEAFLCGGKMKSKKYAMGGKINKYVLGGASELPQQEPLPFPFMFESSVNQIPVVTASRFPTFAPTQPTLNGMPSPMQDPMYNGNMRQVPNYGNITPTTPPTPMQDPAYRDQPFIPTRISPVMEIPSPYNPAYIASQMGPQLPDAENTIPTQTLPETPAQLGTTTGGTGKGSGRGKGTSSAYIPGTEALSSIPNTGRLSMSDVKAGKTLNYADPNWKGVKTVDFQKYVKSKDPKALSKFGADGKWGKETEAAWNQYGKEYLQSIGKFGSTASPSVATIPPYLIDQKNPTLKGPDSGDNKKDKNDLSGINFQKYLGDVMQGLAFAGQLGNLGTVEWENIPKMDRRQIDPAIYQEQLRAARNAQMQNVAGSYSSNQAGQQAAYAQYLNQLTQTLQQVDTTNKQLATETQAYNNQADVQQQVARMQALGAHDAAKQSIWQSFANAGIGINQQYSNQVGQAALASAYPDVYEGLMKDMMEFLSTRNKKQKTSE